jgi:hypothetical protein
MFRLCSHAEGEPQLILLFALANDFDQMSGVDHLSIEGEYFGTLIRNI